MTRAERNRAARALVAARLALRADGSVRDLRTGALAVCGAPARDFQRRALAEALRDVDALRSPLAVAAYDYRERALVLGDAAAGGVIPNCCANCFFFGLNACGGQPGCWGYEPPPAPADPVVRAILAADAANDPAFSLPDMQCWDPTGEDGGT